MLEPSRWVHLRRNHYVIASSAAAQDAWSLVVDLHAVTHFLILTLISVLPMVALVVVMSAGRGPVSAQRSVTRASRQQTLCVSVSEAPAARGLLRRRPRLAASHGARARGSMASQVVYLCTHALPAEDRRAVVWRVTRTPLTCDLRAVVKRVCFMPLLRDWWRLEQT